MMKALVTTLAFGAAVGLTALIISIQNNPRTVTSAQRDFIGEPVDVPMQVLPVSVSTGDESFATTPSPDLTIEEVKVTARPTRRWQAAAPAAATEPELVIPTIVPAPCVQGQYRKLEEHRGVYLTCPGQSQ